ncbi:MAG TPA: phage baseplate assembly protein V [Fimbriimonas sp.]
MPGERFFGKYRGLVVSNTDPLMQGRIQAQVPDVLGMVPSTWALPCLPFAGAQQGLFVVPSVGAGVWIEFEHGDLDYPIWTGGWWSTQAEVPALAAAGPPGVQAYVVQTQAQAQLMLSDVPGPTGGILLKLASGAMIKVDDTGIVITNGQGATISLQGPTVTVNGGALVVT